MFKKSLLELEKTNAKIMQNKNHILENLLMFDSHIVTKASMV